MSIDSGLWATLAASMPLLAAAPFVAAAAYVAARRLQTSARDRAPLAGGVPARAAILSAGDAGVAVGTYAGAADSFDTVGSPPLGTVARRMQDEVLAREQSFAKLRRTGKGAPARILDLLDTGIRIGDGASMLRFGLEVLPSGRPAFRAETHCAVSDDSRTKLAPGATVNVKFGIYGSPVVAVDYAP
ncbi:MAG TPA: hypothetical protein VF611_10345 [Pyrinomonadaceae bacterium]|jgi:hypothetical protein